MTGVRIVLPEALSIAYKLKLGADSLGALDDFTNSSNNNAVCSLSAARFARTDGSEDRVVLGARIWLQSLRACFRLAITVSTFEDASGPRSISPDFARV